MPKISVIVPIYNASKYLHRCIDSIINQTYTHLEIILINDGSTDNSGSICYEYAQKDNRIIVIDKENSGVSSARNTGLDIATGDYIAFVDADDFIAPIMYENLLKLSKSNDSDIAICNYQYGDYKNEDSEKIISYNNVEACRKMLFSNRLGLGISTAPVDKLYKATLFKDVRFLESCHYAEDLLICFELFLKAKKLTKQDSTYYNYIRSESSTVLAKYNLKKTSETLAYEKILSLVKGIDTNLEDYLEHRYFEVVFYHWKQCFELKHISDFNFMTIHLNMVLRKAFKTIKNKHIKEILKLIISSILTFSLKFYKTECGNKNET